MDERARIPVSLPRDNPTQSYWQDPPDAIADLRTTDVLPESADVVIIGSGITGAAVAWHLLQNEPDDAAPGAGVERRTTKRIVMLEARQACSGATGRNGGHTKAASYRSFSEHSTSLGTPAAVKIAQLELANIQAVHAFAQAHNIDCDLNPCDTIDIIYDKNHWDRAQKAVAEMREAMPEGDPAAQYTFHTPAEVRERFHCHDNHYEGNLERVYGGISYFAGSLSGYKLGIGVLKLCLAKGLNLQTSTPAVALRRTQPAEPNSPWTVETPRGTITAKQVALATNGYTAHLVPRLQGVIVPFRGQITAQRPGSAMPHSGCLRTTYSFIYEKGYEYMVPRPAGSRFAGDIIMGGGLLRLPDDGLLEYGTTDDTSLNETVSAYLRETTPRYFGPDWGEDDPARRVRKEWTGIMGQSADDRPLVGEMPGEEGLWLSCSFQGHGMVLCWMCAKALVDMMEGRDGDELEGWIPDAFMITEERLSRRFLGRSL
ncbi:FAD dependent oxidoreductase [Podospora appendiculata]|uniref:FAD dependent oxidoreductase n=1 Tax=Podospora appendiculata TaxID=314037 RepID=A0AAE0X0T7_9PEZI|nr:FAD dependent oxidoreductase [Podospora appendiculata]